MGVRAFVHATDVVVICFENCFMVAFLAVVNVLLDLDLLAELVSNGYGLPLAVFLVGLGVNVLMITYFFALQAVRRSDRIKKSRNAS